MSIAESIIGTHYRYPDYFEVDREKIREFARAVRTTIQRISPKRRPRNADTTQ